MGKGSAMAKAKTIFFCSECGGESIRWVGKCPHCGAWNTMVEQKIEPEPKGNTAGRVQMSRSVPCQIDHIIAEEGKRYRLGIDELDTVLGGGLTPGSSVLLGGEPGIGKSTLLLQAAVKMACGLSLQRKSIAQGMRTELLRQVCYSFTTKGDNVVPFNDDHKKRLCYK